MPSRVIRGEINSSASLNRVSMQADLTFRALIVATDDYGRLDARPEMLKAVLYPARPEATLAKIEKWLAELVAEGCVQLYEVAGRRYLALGGWETHRSNSRRAENSKFPQPPENTGSQGIRGDPGDPGDPPVLRLTSDECKVTSDDKTPRASRSAREISREAEIRVETLIIGVLEAMPGQSVPEPGSARWRNWCETMDQLHRIGVPNSKHPWSWEEIDRRMAWVRRDDFWRAVILSARKFRKHFATIGAKMAAEKGNGKPYQPPPDTMAPKSAYEVLASAALKRLRDGGREGSITAAEIQAEIARVEGSVPE